MTRTIETVGAANRRRRGVVAAGAGAVALLLAFSSIAYACTLLIGTFTVCRPASSTYSSASCAKRVGTGTSTGAVTFAQSGSAISVRGENFSLPGGTVYSLTFATAGQSCHLFNISAGVTSLLGTHDHDGLPLTPEVPKTVNGPDFIVGVTSSTGGFDNVSTPSASPGTYSVCAQDEPERVDGNAVQGSIA